MAKRWADHTSASYESLSGYAKDKKKASDTLSDVYALADILALCAFQKRSGEAPRHDGPLAMSQTLQGAPEKVQRNVVTSGASMPPLAIEPVIWITGSQVCLEFAWNLVTQGEKSCSIWGGCPNGCLVRDFYRIEFAYPDDRPMEQFHGACPIPTTIQLPVAAFPGNTAPSPPPAPPTPSSSPLTLPFAGVRDGYYPRACAAPAGLATGEVGNESVAGWPVESPLNLPAPFG